MVKRNASSITPSAAFGQTLQFITKIKLQELQKQRDAYATHADVLKQASAAGDDLVRKVETLLAAARAWSGSGSIEQYGDVAGNLNLGNLDLWLGQAKRDPSFSKDVLQGWATVLEAHIKHTGTRFEYASLFGNLFNEWVQNEGVAAADEGEGPVGDDSMEAGSADEFVAVGRKEMHEQKDQLTSLIFQEKTTDVAALTAYLDALFSDDAAAVGLMNIRLSNEAFCNRLARATISIDDVRWIIQSLLSADLLDNEKRSTLREFLDSPVVLNEVASVLNMRMTGFPSWAWPAEGVTVEMRRHLNGKYRAFMESEIIDAMFLEFIGKSFQVHFKGVLRGFANGAAWKPSLPPLEKTVLQRRMTQLSEQRMERGIEEYRQTERNSKYFLSQLPDSQSTSAVYDDSGDVPNNQSNASSAVNVKQSLLHFMATEGYLNRTLYGTHTVVRTDFEWFGPSLAHDAVLTVLEYIGVRPDWLAFIGRFLATPIRFKDDPTGEVRLRKCGTPISHALSSLCGETMMFIMDFAVNQRADGLFLYRIHDDLWLWDAESERCIKAWKEMQTFAGIVGLKFNMSKTGTACVGATGADPALPEGDIRWGFLRFDASLGRFVIDQKQVDDHVVELNRQLAATKSIFGWINAYNKYMAFFTRNFGGTPAFCFGPAHADDMIATLARIQAALFPDEGGVIGHLAGMIHERFGITDLPQGYFLFPVGSGGLEVLNPLIELFAIRTQLKEKPEVFFEEQITKDADTYAALKSSWEARPPSRWLEEPRGVEAEFMTFEEYVAHQTRELRSVRWASAFQTLLHTPDALHVTTTPALEAILRAAQGRNGPGGDDQWLARSWSQMRYYQKWVLAMYAEEMVKKFGSLAIVDPTLIPVGMVQLFKSSRMRWEQ